MMTFAEWLCEQDSRFQHRNYKYDLHAAWIDGQEESHKRCASLLDLSDSELLLMSGEMTAQEMRTVKAVLKALKSRMENGYSI